MRVSCTPSTVPTHWRCAVWLGSVLASGGGGEEELQVGYEAALWELLVLCFLRCDDLEMGALPEVCNTGCCCCMCLLPAQHGLEQTCPRLASSWCPCKRQVTQCWTASVVVPHAADCC